MPRRVFHGLGNAFQWPAYSAAVSTMIPKERYGRANGMMSLIEMGPGVLASMLAGALLPLIGLTGILILDVTSFLLAVLVLLFVHIPQPRRTDEGAKAEGNIFKEAAFGWLVTPGPGAGMGLLIVFGSLGGLLAGLADYFVSSIRNAEDILPDHDAQPAAKPA